MSIVRAKKHLGQHFLRDDSIAQRIAGSLPLRKAGESRAVIEVGPGTGALTRHLVTRTDIDLTCFEVDTESVAYLEANYPQLKVLQRDFLRMDPDRISSGSFAVIGNFPYNISSQIVFKVIEHRDRATELVGMFQKEVADRLCAGPGSKTYGVSSVLAQAWYDMHMLFVVEPTAFSPPPKVRSAVIRMHRNTVGRLPCDEALFFRVVKTAFNQRRKTLHNALKSLPELPKTGVPEVFAAKRAEQLSANDFIVLTQACSPGASS